MQTETPAQLQEITTLYGHKMLVNPSDAIGREALQKGIYDHPTIDLLRNILGVQRCRTVLDIGADIGTHTLAFSQLCARVLAFEPAKQSFEILKKNVADNNLRNIKALNFGLSNVDDTSLADTDTTADEAVKDVSLVLDAVDCHRNDSTESGQTDGAAAEEACADADADADADLSLQADADAHSTPEDLRAEQALAPDFLSRTEPSEAANLKSGDAYLKSQLISDVDFIKIDAHGHEQSILEGLKTTVRHCRPLVLVEWSDHDADRAWVTDNDTAQILFPNYQVFALIWNSNKHYWTSKPLGSLRRQLIRIFNREHKRLVQFDPVGHQTQVKDLLLVPREKLPCVSQYVYR